MKLPPPPPPPPPDKTEVKPADEDGKKLAPKKAWTKPTILPIVDGLDATESGPKAEINEFAAYHVPS